MSSHSEQLQLEARLADLQEELESLLRKSGLSAGNKLLNGAALRDEIDMVTSKIELLRLVGVEAELVKKMEFERTPIGQAYLVAENRNREKRESSLFALSPGSPGSSRISQKPQIVTTEQHLQAVRGEIGKLRGKVAPIPGHGSKSVHEDRDASGASAVDVSAEGLARKRASDVQRVREEIDILRPQMRMDADYDVLREKYPEFVVFQECEKKFELKELLLGIQGHTQAKALKFAKDVAASHNTVKFETIKKAWQLYMPVEYRRPQRKPKTKSTANGNRKRTHA